MQDEDHFEVSVPQDAVVRSGTNLAPVPQIPAQDEDVQAISFWKALRIPV